MSRKIGQFDWDACVNCKFCHSILGGCSVPEQEWKDNLRIDVEIIGTSIECGSFEPREKMENEK